MTSKILVKVVVIQFLINNCSLRKQLMNCSAKRKHFFKWHHAIYCKTPKFFIFLRKELYKKACTLQKLNRKIFKENVNKFNIALPQLEMGNHYSPPDHQVKFDLTYLTRTWWDPDSSAVGIHCFKYSIL